MTSPAKPKLTALFYQAASGREPVREWLLNLPNRDDRRLVGSAIGYVQHMWPIGKPRVDHISGDIWEVRCTLPTRIARVLFAVHDQTMVLLHGFIKKTQATPKQDIELAQTRWKDWLQYEQEK
jgi:phage-related protein